MPHHTIETLFARSLARHFKMFARVSASANYLVFYTGNESKPGTWLEAGRTMIDMSPGYCAVSRNAVESIIDAGRDPENHNSATSLMKAWRG